MYAVRVNVDDDVVEAACMTQAEFVRQYHSNAAWKFVDRTSFRKEDDLKQFMRSPLSHYFDDGGVLRYRIPD